MDSPAGLPLAGLDTGSPGAQAILPSCCVCLVIVIDVMRDLRERVEEREVICRGEKRKREKEER